MSLLMEALRKAEQEKKEAAKRLQEQRNAASSGQSAVEKSVSADNSSSSHPALSLEDISAPGVDKSSSTDSQSGPVSAPNLTLAPMVLSSEQLETSAADLTPEQGIQIPETDLYAEYLKGDTTLTEAFDTAEATRTHTASGPQPLVAETTQTQSTVSGQNTVGLGAGSGENTQQGQTLSEERFTDTQRGTLQQRYETTLADKIRAEESHDTSPRQFGPASAEAVFAAKRSPNYTVYTVVTLISLVVVGLAAFGVFYYYSVTPIARDLPSPQVARDVEYSEPLAIAPEVLAPDAVAAPGNGSAEDIEDMTGPLAGQIESATPVDIPDTPAVDADAIALLERDTAGITAAEPQAKVIAEPVAPAPLETGSAPATSTQVTPEMSSQEDDVDMIELAPAMLRISRAQSVPAADQTLAAAYRAFQSGDLASAKSFYQNVLANQPGNRDALLGAAAIALRENQPEVAFGHYIKVLRENPADKVAQAALTSLQGGADPVRHESRIKNLLAVDPEAAYLYFTLGNLYALQSRWPDAQQAFFDAYTRADDNADYALNLAVSLDRLGQPQASLEYYRRAVLLAEEYQRGSFDRVTVSRRIQEIQDRLERP